MSDDFNTPDLSQAAAQPAPQGFASKAVVPASNSGKTDELSLAVAASRRVVAPEPAKPEPPGIYCLDYVYNGDHIHETHRTIKQAIARLAALKRIGIVPATSVAEQAAA